MCTNHLKKLKRLPLFGQPLLFFNYIEQVYDDPHIFRYCFLKIVFQFTESTFNAVL